MRGSPELLTGDLGYNWYSKALPPSLCRASALSQGCMPDSIPRSAPGSPVSNVA